MKRWRQSPHPQNKQIKKQTKPQTNELKTNGIVKVGYYVLSALETQKVDLTNYVKNTDYASSSKAGVIKMGNVSTGLRVLNGQIYVYGASETEINSRTTDRPITPKSLVYAVQSVVGAHITLTQDEYDALEMKNENAYYFIVEE